MEYLSKEMLIKKSQHGFLPRRSCLTNLLEYLEKVTMEVDKGNPVDVVYIDFQKAFDKVPHKRLIHKLAVQGINGNVRRWIADWLRERKQRVVVNGYCSDWLAVESGVPQGSVLGPLLFLIYVNDIEDGIESKVLKFADDIKILREVSTKVDVETLKLDLQAVAEWSTKWQMPCNIGKSSVMHFGYNNRDEEYFLGVDKLKSVDVERDLGVIVDKTLKRESQCSRAVKAANSTLGMIKRSFRCRDKEIMLQMYKVLVRPRLEYCVQAWSPYLRKDIDLLERVQRRATKMINGLNEMDYYERLEQLGLTTLETRRIRGDLIEVFKIIKGFEDINRDMFFEESQMDELRGHSEKLFKKRSRLDIRKCFFTNRVINEWNALSEEMIKCENVNIFKKKLDNHLRYNRGYR